MDGQALVADCLTNLAHDRRELLEVVLEEVQLTVIVLLDTIESVTVLGADLIDVLIDKFDVSLVLVLCLAR